MLFRSTIVQVTHRLEEVIGADRVIVLDQGRFACEGTPAQLFRLKDIGARWGLEVPPVVILRERLVAAGLIAKDTPPTAEGIGTALCLSSSKI